MSDQYDEQAKALRDDIERAIDAKIAAALRELGAENERLNELYKKQCETLAERNAEIRHYDDYLHRCNAALGDAGVLVSDGAIDGIGKIINERDDLRQKLAAAERERDEARAALEEIAGAILGRDDLTPHEAAREMERIAQAALAAHGTAQAEKGKTDAD